MSKHSRWVVVAVVLLFSGAFAGCGVQVALTKRPDLSEQPRELLLEQPCNDVMVLNGRAPYDWEVVAVVDLAAFSVRALPRDDEAFLELVRPAVCEAGGDAVIAGVNGNGRYVLGTVIAWVVPAASSGKLEGGAKPAAASGDAEEGSKPVAGPAEGAGDTAAAVPVAGHSPRTLCSEDATC